MKNDADLRVYKLLRKLPKGVVTTYGAIGKKLGMNPRHVGFVLSRNKHPEKYPCYKVIKSDGSIGGYTSGKNNNRETSEQKKRKLLADGVIINGSKVSKNSIIRRL